MVGRNPERGRQPDGIMSEPDIESSPPPLSDLRSSERVADMAMENVTVLLEAVRSGNVEAGGALLSEVYAELRRMAAGKMAAERPGQTLQPTALVHEAWLRLADGDGQVRFENRAHFFGAAAEAMRRILIEAARRKNAMRRGGGAAAEDIQCLEIAAPMPDDELLAVDEALELLAAHDRRKAELVKLRYFAGLTLEEAAAVLDIGERTAKRDWAYAKAWLLDTIRLGGERSVREE